MSRKFFYGVELKDTNINTRKLVLSSATQVRNVRRLLSNEAVFRVYKLESQMQLISFIMYSNGRFEPCMLNIWDNVSRETFML